VKILLLQPTRNFSISLM